MRRESHFSSNIAAVPTSISPPHQTNLAIVEAIFHSRVPVCLDFGVAGLAPIYFDAPRNSFLHTVLRAQPFWPDAFMQIYALALRKGAAMSSSALMNVNKYLSDGDLDRLLIYFTCIVSSTSVLEHSLIRTDCLGADDEDKRVGAITRQLTVYALPTNEGNSTKQNEIHVQWHRPIGVLYDLYCGCGIWHINARIAPDEENYPTSIFLYSGDQSLEAQYINSLKESEYMRHGSVKNIMQMSKEDTVELWRGVSENLLSAAEPRLDVLLHSDPVTRYWPLRIFLPDKREILPTVPGTQANNSVLSSRAASTLTAATVLRDAIEIAVPWLLSAPAYEYNFKSQLNEMDAKGSVCHRFYIQGLDIDLDTPLNWLYRHLVCPNGWLYVHVRGITTHQAT